MSGVIACQLAEQVAEIRGLDVIQQRIKCLLLFARQDKIVAFLEKRNEGQPVLMRGGLQANRRPGTRAGLLVYNSSILLLC